MKVILHSAQISPTHLSWSVAKTPFGEALGVVSSKGLLCAFEFLSDSLSLDQALHRTTGQWPGAKLTHTPASLEPILSHLVNPQHPCTVDVLVRGTPFQVKVWQALADTHLGSTLTYTGLAWLCGQPKSARAVGNALAANCVAWVIPCHRVLCENGSIGQFRWQAHRKVQMQVWEQEALCQVA